MKFIADENMDFQIVDQLRRNDFSVLYVAEMAPGISDMQVLDLANNNAALLLTSDRDFGEMVFRRDLVISGVVLIRLAGLSAETKATIVLSSLKAHQDELHGAFTVIAPGHIRIRRKFH